VGPQTSNHFTDGEAGDDLVMAHLKMKKYML
jgi:hypothetical protein